MRVHLQLDVIGMEIDEILRDANNIYVAIHVVIEEVISNQQLIIVCGTYIISRVDDEESIELPCSASKISRSRTIYAAIQTTSKHFVSPLNSRQAVHKC